MTEYVRCPECDRVIAARIPKGGDGTAVRPVHHLHTVMVQSAGSERPVWRNVKCPGTAHPVDRTFLDKWGFCAS